jgi:hypothetical protein
MYADDTSIFFTNAAELGIIKSTLDLYATATDAKFNLAKSYGVSLNLPRNMLADGVLSDGSAGLVDWLPDVHSFV